jgi:hypothetical protein
MSEPLDDLESFYGSIRRDRCVECDDTFNTEGAGFIAI